MKTKLSFCVLALLCPLFWVGCASTTTIVEKKDKITTPGLDTQDFADKAGEMIQSLVEKGVLDKVPRKPAVVDVGRVINDTGFQIQLPLLTDKIRVALNKGSKAVTNVGGLTDPDFTLSGRITETRKRQGETREHTYTFKLMLVNPQGLAVWEEETEITKHATRGSVGVF